jgi:ribose/xylose/arabinose/galactoside ABC-type transport system permease subunit
MNKNVKAMLQRPWMGPLIAVFVVHGIFAIIAPETLAHFGVIELIARQTVIVALAAVGMTIIMIQGGIDLSVGSVVALTTVVVARALEAGMSPLIAVAAGLIAATACGAFNGALVAWLEITPFIVTLGTMSILRGTAKGVAREQTIAAEGHWVEELMGVPEGMDWMLLPPGVWVTAIVAVVAAVVLNHTRLGRHIVAVGSNERTAMLCGVPVKRVTIIVYAIGGLLAGLAGVMEFATLTLGDPTDSIGLELAVIAAVVIGGGSLAGGQGSIVGAIFGALLMTVISNGCTNVGVPNWVQEILTGAIIIVAVALDRVRNRSTA